MYLYIDIYGVKRSERNRPLVAVAIIAIALIVMVVLYASFLVREVFLFPVVLSGSDPPNLCYLLVKIGSMSAPSL